MSRTMRRMGFTLLEVVLALSLTVVVMAAIGLAIFLHLHSVDRTRVSIERDGFRHLAIAHCRRCPFGSSARAVRRFRFAVADEFGGECRKIAGRQFRSGESQGGSGGSKDGRVRAQTPVPILVPTPTPNQTAKKAAASQAPAVPDPRAPRAAGKAGTAGTLSSSGESADSGDAAAAGAPAAVAGLYGTAYELQIDVARVPRPDEFAAAIIAGSTIPSDVKTVYYFLANAATGLSAAGQSGLMRSEMNRAAALYASQNGDYDIFMRNAESLAPEVGRIGISLFRRHPVALRVEFTGDEWVAPGRRNRPDSRRSFERQRSRSFRLDV